MWCRTLENIPGLFIKNENQNFFNQLTVTNQQFTTFIERHKDLERKNVIIAAEDNEQC